MAQDHPNILLIVTDQHRGDALGIEGHPVLQTAFLDAIAAAGIRFSRAYTACPICVAARRTLISGQRPRTHGVLSNYDTLLTAPTLPGELGKAGYQTHLVGKLHLYPVRKLYGFHSADWADSPRAGYDDDYQRFLVQNGITGPRASSAHGMNINGWAVRPWHLEERFHFSHWCADRSIDFLERRDPTMPFFLELNLFHPHQPLTPPEFYYNRYMNMGIPAPVVGDWARVFDGPVRGLPVASWRTCLDPIVMKQYQAAYYASINYLDDQIGRVLDALPRDTIIVFTSDHGDMVGDHQWIRKRNAYEGSARIPMIMRFPEWMNLPGRQVIDKPVELMDVMPTLLEAAGVPVPPTVEGRSVLSLVRGQSQWRPYVHGESCEVPSLNSGMQYLTDGKRKYVYLPGPGVEQYFNLENDPREMVNLAGEPAYAAEITHWREILIGELAGRPEGFTDGHKLIPLGRATMPVLPGFERKDPAGHKQSAQRAGHS